MKPLKINEIMFNTTKAITCATSLFGKKSYVNSADIQQLCQLLNHLAAIMNEVKEPDTNDEH